VTTPPPSGRAAAANGHEPTVLLETDGGVRRLVLNRPDRHNAQTAALWQEFAALGEQLTRDPDVRCVIVTGAGPSFSSGLDRTELQPGGLLTRIAEVGQSDVGAAEAMIADIQRTFDWIRRAPFPVIAAVHGAALGAGFELALACDLLMVADDARLALPEVSMGVVPDLGSCHALRAALGYQHAMDLVLTGRALSGLEAAELRLALQHHPHQQLDDAVMNYAQAVARSSPVALRHAKRALLETDDHASLTHAATGMVRGLNHVLTASPSPRP